MMNELSNTDTAFLQYLCFGMNVLSNLRNVFDSSSLEGKQKLVGLIFPEKLIYDNGNYRTKSESAVYQLLLNADKVFGENKKGQDTKNRELSFMVARRGIEHLFPP
jgi:site-specific DNA recombinase